MSQVSGLMKYSPPFHSFGVESWEGGKTQLRFPVGSVGREPSVGHGPSVGCEPSVVCGLSVGRELQPGMELR